MIYRRIWRDERRLMAVVFIIVFALYAYTAARYVTLEDDALFIGALHFFGVSHPPGYPAHTALGGIFYHLLPFGSPALKAHLFSGFAGAAACVALYAVVRLLSPSLYAAIFAALAYAVSKTFWSQSVIAEVYTLNSFFFFALLALCLVYINSEAPSRRLVVWMGIVCGLALAVHYPLFSLAAVGFLFVIPFWRRLSDLALGGITAVVVALSFYAWMIWRSFVNPVYNFYGAIENFDAFRFYFLRRGYAGIDQQSGVDWHDKINFLKFLGTEAIWQYTPLGFCFVLIGCWVMLASPVYRRLTVALLVSVVMSSVALVFLLNFNATPLGYAIFSVYPLIAYGIMAIWLVFGVAAIISSLRHKWRHIFAVGLLTAVVGVSLGAHWHENNRRADRWAHDLAVTKLRSLENGAILLVNADFDLPLGYLHYVERMRPDLQVYSDQGLIYNNRLYGPLLPATAKDDERGVGNKTDVLRDFIRLRYRPVYYNIGREDYFKTIVPGADVFGFFLRVRQNANGESRVILADSVRQWLANTLVHGDDIPQIWTRYQLRGTIVPLITALRIYEAKEGITLSDAWQEVADRATDKYPLIRINAYRSLLKTGDMSALDKEEALAWIKNLAIDKTDLPDDDTRSDFYFLRAALIAAVHGVDAPGFATAVDDAWQYAVLENYEALTLAADYYQATGRVCDLVAVFEKFYTTLDEMPEKWRKQILQTGNKKNCPISLLATAEES